ncbi:MFS transporter [uncultured Bifidobacterium sp.]|uniref:MFS transporter n=1 Tax=uncultured Bifidobacterium sp. TaxID=165187 RepID=UPI00258F0381|nr:MFS transporter [uncultured Bifidobacterium sp.]
MEDQRRSATPKLADDTMLTAKDAGRHSWRSIKLLLATLIVSTLGDGFCSVMMSVALPNISETYDVSLATANWVTVGYAIVAATAVMTAASALARLGLKRMFFWSRILLIVSSVIGLCSVVFPMMLASRLIQAVGAGLMFPAINTVIIRVVPARHSGRIVSLNGSIIGVDIAVAPLLSDVFLTYVSLTSMYVVPLAIGVVSLVMGLKFTFDVEARRDAPIDVLSVLLAFAGLATVMLGFSELTHRPPLAVTMLVAGLAILAVFTWRQSRLTSPLLDLRPMRHLYVSDRRAAVPRGRHGPAGRPVAAAALP